MKTLNGPFFILAIIAALALLIVVALLVPGCKPNPYPPCNASQVNATQCSGEGEASMVQRCDGTHWMPSMACSEVAGADGELIGAQCVETDSGARCRPPDSGGGE